MSDSPSPPSPGLLSLDEALSRLLAAGAQCVIQQAEDVATLQAWGRVLAEDVRSGLDVPPAAVSYTHPTLPPNREG